MRKNQSWLLRAFAAICMLGLAPLAASAYGAPAGILHPRMHIRSLKALGYTYLPKGPANPSTRHGPAHQVAKIHDTGHFTGIHAPSSVLSIPAPHGSRIAATNPGNRGFAGLTELDQYNAGTGSYASTQGPAEPPDQGLCTGNGLVLEAINDGLAAFAPNGARLTPVVPLNQFFHRTPEYTVATGLFGDFISDPKCYFDPQTDRWFLSVVELAIDPFSGGFTNTGSSVLIAVSLTSMPFAGWALFQLDTTDADGSPDHLICPCGPDQPLLGADSNGIYITTNEFGMPFSSTSFNGAQVYAISKPGLIQAASPQGSVGYRTLPRVIQYSGLMESPGNPYYSIQPATNPGGIYDMHQGGTEHFLSSLDFSGGTPVQGLAAWTLTDTSSLASAHATPAINTTLIDSEAYAVAPPALQKGGSRPLATTPGLCNALLPFFSMCGAPLSKIDSGDDRMNQVVYANGLLWGALTTGVIDVTGKERSGLAYFVVRPRGANGVYAPEVVRQGYLSLDGAYLMYPSVAVNSAGNGLIAFSATGSGMYPSAAYAPIDLAHGVGDVHLMARGALPEDGVSGYSPDANGVARWGDYTAAVGAKDGSIWMAAEYIPNAPREPFANWGTFVGNYTPGAIS